MANLDVKQMVQSVLESYSQDIKNGITEIADEVSEQAKDNLVNCKSTYKKRTGKYNKGWKVNKEHGDKYVKDTVHNSTQYQLTHLLEYGHLTRDGKSHTKAFVHIAPVHDKACEDFKNKVEELIENGGK